MTSTRFGDGFGHIGLGVDQALRSFHPSRVAFGHIEGGGDQTRVGIDPRHGRSTGSEGVLPNSARLCSAMAQLEAASH